MKIFLTLLFVVATMFASEDKYSLRVSYGDASYNDLGTVLMGNMASTSKRLSALEINGGYKLDENLFDLPIDSYAKMAITRFDESAVDGKSNVYGINVHYKLYYNFFEKSARFGFAEGVSYTTNILYAEAIDAAANNDNTSKFLNYLDFSIDFNTGKLFKTQSLKNTYLGFAIKHRSGIFGLIHNVKHGGSNYKMFYIESNF